MYINCNNSRIFLCSKLTMYNIMIGCFCPANIIFSYASSNLFILSYKIRWKTEINYVDFDTAIFRFSTLFTHLQAYDSMEFFKRKRKERFGMFKHCIFNQTCSRVLESKSFSGEDNSWIPYITVQSNIRSTARSATRGTKRGLD